MTAKARIVGFCCAHGAVAAADLAGENGLQYSADVAVIEVPCTGRVDVLHILKAFREGADAVFVAGCLEKNCHHEYGNVEAGKRVAYAKHVLDALGLDGRRVEMFHLASNQAFRFIEIADEMTKRVEELGRNPLGAGH
jgi:F420-non-reducing hydrogenase iron-sulfur subunit